MVSFRFPFSFSQPPRPKPPRSTSSRRFSAAYAAGIAFGSASVAAIAVSEVRNAPIIESALGLLFPSSRSSLPWGSLSLADGNADEVVESRTGFSFPAVIDDHRRLLGIGLRKKSVLGLKNIDVYAFGVYADSNDVKTLLGEKYRNMSASELSNGLLEADIRMTVRLQIVYGKLSIRSVRTAFEESVGNRLQKFGGSNNKELLQSFTSLFKDEFKIPRGSVIDLSREPGYVLRTTIDGKEVGSIESKLLCRSLFDLYIGEEPFDRQAKEDVAEKVASLIDN